MIFFEDMLIKSAVLGFSIATIEIEINKILKGFYKTIKDKMWSLERREGKEDGEE